MKWGEPMKGRELEILRKTSSRLISKTPTNLNKKEENKMKNQEIWEITEKIIKSMKYLNSMKEEDRKKIFWNDLEEEWFDYLEDKINGKGEK